MKSKKTNKLQFLITVTALLLIVLIGAGVTYSWIEGGTTYTIKTANDGDVKTGSKPDTQVIDGLTINPLAGKTVSLQVFDKNTNVAQDLYFSAGSSADGTNIYFPTAYNSSGNPTAYRLANTNDIGTKFINYSFNVNVAKKCFLAFDGTPTITATKNGQKIDDVSAFRIMVKCGSTTKILNPSDATITGSAVTSTTGTKKAYTAESVAKYVYNPTIDNKLFDLAANYSGPIEISIWLEGTGVENSDLLGSDVIVDMNLIAAQESFPIVFNSVTSDLDGNKTVGDFTGGKLNNLSESFTYYKFEGTTFSVTAEPNTGYEFVGWYTNQSCTGTAVSTSKTLSKTVTGSAQYYALFKAKPKATVSVSAIQYPGGTAGGGTVTVNGSGTSYYGYKDTTVSLSATPNTNYRFDGWYTNKACTGTAYSTSTTASATVGATNQTYYAKFVKQCRVRLTPAFNGAINNNVASSLKVESITGSPSLSTTGEEVDLWVDAGTTVNYYAVAKSGYKFAGFYNGVASTSSLASTPMQINNNVTVYAHFEAQAESTTTIYFAPRSGYSSYYAHVYSDAGANYTQKGAWPGDQATYDSATGYYKYQFTTSDTGNFRLVVSDNGNNSTQYPALNATGLEGTIGKTYLLDGTTLTEYDPNAKVTIYVTDSKSWGTMNCYAWVSSNTSDNNGWPGVTMTKDKINDMGQQIYKIELDPKYDSIIFNNGSQQTVDISGFSNGTAYYIADTKNGNNWNVGTWTYS